MKTQVFDTIVVGSGTSAYFCITALNKARRKLAVVDERPYGGTCALRGCQPKKYLVANAEAVAMAAHLSGIGLSDPPQTNWSTLQELKNEFLDGRSEGEIEEFNKAGITTFFGKAKLVGPDEVAVGDERLKAEHIVLATGAVPRKSDIPGSQYIRDSEYFLNQPGLPKQIIFIGGGYISFEFAHVASRAGSKVTILHRSARALKTFDPDMVGILVEAGEASGISLIVNESPERIEQSGSGYRLHGKSGEHYEADLILGAHLARHNASEIINIFALAIKYGIHAKALSEFLWVYPTYTSDIKYMVG